MFEQWCRYPDKQASACSIALNAVSNASAALHNLIENLVLLISLLRRAPEVVANCDIGLFRESGLAGCVIALSLDCFSTHTAW